MARATRSPMVISPIARAPQAAPNSSSWTSRKNEAKACICYIFPRGHFPGADHPLRDGSVVGPGKTSETFSISNPDCCTAHIGRRPRKSGYSAPTLCVDDGVGTQFFGFCCEQRVQAFGTVVTGTKVCLHRAEDFVLDPGWNCLLRNKNRTFRCAG